MSTSSEEDALLDWPIVCTSFLRDLHQIVLGNLGSATEGVEDDLDAAMTRYIAFQHLQVPQRPRAVHYSDVFRCPDNRLCGLRQFEMESNRGADLRRRQSKRVWHANHNDYLLWDWGINHFHLGIQLLPRKNRFKDTCELLFAIVRPDDIYAIQVLDHRNFEDRALLEIAERNWPHLFRARRVKGVTGQGADFDASRIKHMRYRNRTNYALTINGATYVALGGGYMSNGMSASVRFEVDHWIRNTEYLEQRTRAQWQDIARQVRTKGREVPAQISLQLLAEDDGFYCKMLPTNLCFRLCTYAEFHSL